MFSAKSHPSTGFFPFSDHSIIADMFRKVSLSAMVFTYFFAGLAHVFKTDYYLGFAPFFYRTRFIVLIFGSVEILIAVLLSFPKTRRGACYGILLLWSVSLPINIYTVMSQGSGTSFTSWQLKTLIPFHLFLMVWAIWHIRTPVPSPKLAKGKKLQFLGRD